MVNFVNFVHVQCNIKLIHLTFYYYNWTGICHGHQTMVTKILRHLPTVPDILNSYKVLVQAPFTTSNMEIGML